MELVTSQATKAGFYGGIVVDYPNSTKAKKFFLVLMTGGNMPLPTGLRDENATHGKFFVNGEVMVEAVQIIEINRNV